MNPLRSIGPTLHVCAAAGAAGAGAAAGACAGAAAGAVAGAAEESAGAGAGVCAPAVRAIAIAAPAIDRRIAVVFECIDTVPPREDLCMMGDDAWDTHGAL